MHTLQDLGQRIDDKLAAHRHAHFGQLAVPQPPNVEHAQRRFGEIAEQLLHDIICPRLEKLASYFDNAEVLKPDEHDRRYTCLCRFRPTSRFTASARFEMSLSHDPDVEHLLAFYRLELGPAYVPFKGQVQLVFPIAKVNEDELVRWIDDQIVDFVDAYLGFEYSGQTPDLVVDPVCGMVLNRNYVAAQTEYQGKTYCFCVANCRNKFMENPGHYATEA
jgi:YHS domain-containing protein